MYPRIITYYQQRKNPESTTNHYLQLRPYDLNEIRISCTEENFVLYPRIITYYQQRKNKKAIAFRVIKTGQ